jgi:uncharacterized iron-regulated membrane protein
MWDWAIWAALAIAFAAGLAAAGVLAMRVRELWQSFKAVRRNVVGELDELGAKGEETAERASAVDTAEVQASVTRLRASLAQLAVLRQALDEAQDVFDPIAPFVPRP